MKIEIDPQELDKLLDTIVALKTRMQERNVKSINTKNGKIDYSLGWTCMKPDEQMSKKGFNNKKNKPLLHICDTCAYSSLSWKEPPCSTCGIEKGRHDNWKERTETE